MTTLPDEPEQSTPLARVAKALGITELLSSFLAPEQRKRNQKTTAAMIEMGENHRKALHVKNAYRRTLVEDANRLKAEAPEAAVTDDYPDRWVMNGIGKLSDEIDRLTASQNDNIIRDALAKEPEVVEVVDVTPTRTSGSSRNASLVTLSILFVFILVAICFVINVELQLPFFIFFAFPSLVLICVPFIVRVLPTK